MRRLPAASKRECHTVSRRRFVAGAIAAASAHAQEFRSEWSSTISRPWLGPDYWANPLQDWRLRNGRLECFVAGGDRHVILLTRELSPQAGELQMSVRFGRLEEDQSPLGQGFVGFRFGIRGQFGDYRDTAVHGIGVNAGVTGDGMLFIADPETQGPRINLNQQNLTLRLQAAPEGEAYRIALEVADEHGAVLASVIRNPAPREWLHGGLGLVCSSGQVVRTPHPPFITPSGQDRRDSRRGGTLRFWFRDWTVSGSKLVAYPERAYGPILFALHTLSRRVLKMTAQLAPLDDPGLEVHLQIRQGNSWRTVSRAQPDPLSRTVHYRIASWDDSRDIPYRLLLRRKDEEGATAEHTLTGTIRKDPRNKDRITVAALTCCNDLGFPHSEITRALKHHNPDILFFTGDQIYERVGGYGNQLEPIEQATLDYLRKWYIFGWAFGDLFRDIPVVTLPDDHDVYHGNIWGAGGKKASAEGDPEASTNRVQALQDSGGFKMPALWVNMVQRTQTSHLPDPYDPTPVEQGITVYYTELVYGGVSFALIEDRKWKSAPRGLIPAAAIRNGWAQNPRYEPVRDGDVKGAELLGKRQMEFLERWAADWSHQVWMKAVVSQTIWTNLCTLPPPANTDAVTPRLPLLAPGAYPENEVHTADHDSNGWPQTARNEALRVVRKALAFHIGGDQHLGSTVQYGIDQFNDGPYVICTPAISNFFPRRWYPPKPGRNRPAQAPRYCGEYFDGFGNRMTVHAVANPQRYGVEPAIVNDRAPGYGIIELERSTRKITFTNWPRWVDPSRPGAKPYPGWPITIHQLDNGSNGAPYHLPPLVGLSAEVVVQVVEEATKEIVCTVRASSAEMVLGVPREGAYTVRLIPDKGPIRELRGQLARKRA
ncbi:MAG: alkaline phosphatase D family protein [Bryobacteraceae bacterium]|nr:alkaline phosphatase D family protein [Bryobacteraceae bacterium]MDW8378656.1 alkaline phosphatase D family protein [Bryobacterales bacterium]